MNTITVNAAATEAFLKKVSKINAKAVKLGMEPLEVIAGETFEHECGTETLGAYMKKGKPHALYTEYTLIGEAPVIEGYETVASVDLRGTKPVVRKAPFTAVDLSAYHETDGRCEHCDTVRQRNDVLIVREKATGKMLQIGRNCAADFFRSKDATAVVRVSDYINDLYETEWDNVGLGEPRVSLTTLFTVAAAVVRTFGWVSSTMAFRDDTLVMTRSRVWQNLRPWTNMPKEDRVVLESRDEEEAKKVIDWVVREFLSKDPAQCNDFERNVQAAVEGDEEFRYVRDRNFNYLIWAINGYTRALQKEQERRAAQEAKERRAKVDAASGYVGTVGKREVFEGLKLEFRRGFGSQYGIKYLLKFRDVDGNIVVWWSTAESVPLMILDEVYTLKATVKAHEEHEGVNQTSLSRAQILDGKLDD